MTQSVFVRQQKEIRSDILTVQMDGVVSESHSNAIQLTQNPVETGVTITDHAVISPRELVIVGVITDTPFGNIDLGAVSSIGGLFGASTSNAQTRTQQGYAQMVYLMNERDIVTIQTELALYENFVITNIATTQDVNSSQSALMHITLTEVLIAHSLTEAIEESQLEPGAVAKQASTPNSKGKIQAQEPAPENQQTWAKSLSGWLH